MCVYTYIHISKYGGKNVRIYKHVEVYILSSNTKNQCMLYLNSPCIFQDQDLGNKVWV